MRKILSVLLMFMFVISFVVAIDDLMTLQGNIKESGVNLASGNISVYIFTTATGGNVIWNSTLNGKDDFNNSISDGKYDLLLGNVTGNELTLEYGQLYYLEMFVNEEGFSFNGSDRQVFQSSVGQINGSFIGANQINKTHFNGNLTISQIDGYENLVFSNDSVTFDSGFNVTVGSGGWFFGIFNWVIDVASGSISYFTFNGTTLTFDEDKLNSTIDSRSSAVANLSTKNIFNQHLNTTSNVEFGNLTVTGNLSVDEYIYHNGNTDNYIQFIMGALEISKPTTFAGTIHADTRISLGAAGGTGIVQAADNTGTDAEGGSLQLYGGKSTGAGRGGDIQFIVSPEGSSGISANPWMQALHIEGNGNVGIGTTSPQQLLNVDGNVNITGGLNLSSYISCETLETDANGNVLCGTDADTGRVNVFDQLLNKTSNVEFANITSTGNLTVAGIAEFGGGWQAGGVTITGGDIYLESLFVVNITSLGITNLEVNGSLFPELNNTFDLGNGSHIWRNGYFGGEVYIGGSAVSTWLYNQTELGSFNFNQSDIAFNYNQTELGSFNFNQSDIAFNYNQTDLNGSLWNVATGGIQYNGGNVGIGTLSPANELNIVGDPAQRINLTSTDSGSPKEAGIVLGSGGEEWRMAFDQNARNGDLTFRAINSVVGQFGQNGSLQVDGNIISDGTDPNYFLGSIGIGTASPATELDIYDSSSPELRIRTSAIDGRLSADTTNGLVLYPTTEHTLSLGSNGTKDTIVITSDRVGIGTASPGALLAVEGAGGLMHSVIATSGGNAQSRLQLSGNEYYDLVADADSFQIEVSDTDAFVIDDERNVGIGTSTPSAKLDVAGDIEIGNGADARFRSVDGSRGSVQISYPHLSGDIGAINRPVSYGNNLFINVTGNYDKANDLVGGFAMFLGANNGAHGELEFVSLLDTDDSTVTTVSRMIIDSNGNVGIGTSSPEYLLEADGNFSANKTLFVITAGNVGIGTASPGSLLEILQSGSTPAMTISGIGTGGAEIDLDRHSEGSWEAVINFQTAGNQEWQIGLDNGGGADFHFIGDVGTVMTLADSSGNVGIGTTSPTEKLHIVNPAYVNLSNAAGSNNTLLRLKDSFEQTTNNNNFRIMTRREADSTTWLNSAYRLEKNIDDNQNARVWMEFINGGSTTDNLITFGEGGGVNNEWMRIDNGKVGIGTSSPQQLLNVDGNVNITGGLNLSSYISCGVLETDANGNVICGDGIGGGDLTSAIANATYEVQLANEAGLYAVLSDVSEFIEAGDTLVGEDIGDNTIDEDSIDFGTGTDQVSLLDFGLAATHDTSGELDALYEVQLANEAGLYAVLSDVSEFIEAGDSPTFTDLTLTGGDIHGAGTVSLDIGEFDGEGFTFTNNLSDSSYPEFNCYDGNGATLCEFRTGLYVSGGSTYIAGSLYARGGFISDDDEEDFRILSERGMQFLIDSDNGDETTDEFLWNIGSTSYGGGTQLMALTEGGDLLVSGKVGIGTEAPGMNLTVIGDMNITGGIYFPDLEGDGSTRIVSNGNNLNIGGRTGVMLQYNNGNTYYAHTYYFAPQSNDTRELGTPLLLWETLFVNDINSSGDLLVSGESLLGDFITFIKGGDGINFVDANTRIYESSDDLIFEADDDIIMQPDDDIYLNPAGLLVIVGNPIAPANIDFKVEDGGVCIGTNGCTIPADGFLSVDNAISAGTTTSYAYNNFGTQTNSPADSDGPDSGQITTDDDMFITDDLEVDGTLYLTSGSSSISTADVAEVLLTKKGREATLCNGDPNCVLDEEYVNDELDFGDLVCINPIAGQTIEKCTEVNSRLVVGVVSNTSVLNMGNSMQYGYPIAVAGVVWTKVSTENGDINPGDLLVSASRAGYAMKNNDPRYGTVIGKAYDFCKGESECSIPIFVALG